ncbi:branched-chain amino acid transaminase [Amphiplicatus metriothermophilus]|uniref:Branched-chain-amino-acid aminotransferase n=1 Tax=Amphiplicatus metriothermophilus TaxID=1519374 RepID=A0A239PPK0_9PROT|nr:branched-chain amino acid transaminase [Amphiplicatus metriothermophilus]MBB5518613.1 branched-chain amino acid aminotransferase [Amphiplicatus metriothermophilus]SNT72229.1 branched-chain amino acid aminotransferase [Amphiplicatus metriothermophilus]
MPIQEAKLIWRNGKLVPWAEATTHVLTHGLHYGSGVFEGMRAYDARRKGVAIFRNREHIERLLFSAKVYKINIDYSAEDLMAACREVVRENGLKSAYIRPIAYLGYGEMGPASQACPTDVVIAAFPWGAYLGEEGLANGIDVCVSSWRRPAPGTIPAGVKAAGNYLSSRLVSMEAKDRGFAEGIGLSHDGTVSEGAGENLFVVLRERIITPPAASSILAGITRDTVMTLARALGYEVVEQPIPREMLYAADELFFTGTAAEVTPVRSVDRIPVGTGARPVTKKIQSAFFGLFTGETEDKWGWLDPVE